MPSQQRISLNPANPVQGGTVLVCYDFTDTTLTETELTVTFSPGGQVSVHTVTPQNPCVTVTVPNNATSVVVRDGSKLSPDKSAAVQA